MIDMSFINPHRFTTRPEIEGTFGVVASTHWIATAVGMGILERGGNAFDAGVATAFTLQIVEPHLNGPGGDVPIMVYDTQRRRAEVICAQGPAPAGATMAYYKGLGLELVPGTGPLAACIPGCFDAYMLTLRDYGTMRLEEVLAAAIGYARAGHPMLERASATIATVKDQFLNYWPTSAALWLEQESVPAPGTIFHNSVLADTYERILRDSLGSGGREAQIERARRVWSEGFVADAIDRFCRTQKVMDVSGQANRGVLTGADMAGWSATVEAPIEYEYGRYRVQKPGPWCQGITALQQFALLKGFPLEGLDPTSPDFIHWQVEAAKLAFADRDTFYGDPDFVVVPVETLLSDVYNAKRRALISERASLEQRPGDIPGYGKALETKISAGVRTAVGAGGAGEPTVGRLGETKGDTVHFDIIDRFGNMMCATPSGGWLQSSPTIPELGF
jgi:gamma-glutamyltranspeptidase/glutathione hydrolase